MEKIFNNLFVSSPNGGGLFLLYENSVFRLDNFDTTGIWGQGKNFVRGLQPKFVQFYRSASESSTNFLEFDDIHDVIFYGGFYYVVGTSKNEIVKLNNNIVEVERWKFSDEEDSLHINCLGVWNKKIVFSAFGDFTEHLGYKGKTFKSGFVQDLLTGQKLIVGLSQPHSLTPIDSNLLLANSEKNSLSEYDLSGNLIREKIFEGYTRGICLVDNFIYVGLSKSRNVELFGIEKATIIALDKNNFEEIGRIHIPSNEVYSIHYLASNSDLIHVLSNISSDTVSKFISKTDEQNKNIATLSRAVVDHNNQIALLEKDIEILRRNINERNRQISELRAELERIRTSVSYRMTFKISRVKLLIWLYLKVKNILKPIIKIAFWKYFYDRIVLQYSVNLYSNIELSPFTISINFNHKQKRIVSAEFIYDEKELINCDYNGDVISFTSQIHFSQKKHFRLNVILENGKKRSLKIKLKNLPKIKFSKNKHSFPICKIPIVSIIIPAFNNFWLTYSCLLSLFKNIHHTEYEILIADDNSIDETKDITEYFPNIRHIRNQTNIGFLNNCNNAATYARGRYIVFLNNDTNIQKNWLESLVETVENDKNIGLVGSKLINLDRSLQEAGGIIWKDATAWNYGYGDDPEKSEYNYVKEADYISGASILIRKELWELIGGFDKRYAPAYYEDTDLAMEMRKLGYKVAYQPFSRVFHLEGMSHGKNLNSGTKTNQLKNQKIFFEKWKTILEKEQFSNGECLFLARNRSKNKKTVLVIDHYIPEIDKDAGSKSTYSHLLAFLKIGLSVIFVPDDFYRKEPYTSHLEKLGIEVLYGNWYSQNFYQWLETASEYINFVYLSRPHIAQKHIDTLLCLKNRPKIIYYGQDLHYLREMRQAEIEKSQAKLEKAAKTKEIEIEILKKVDLAYFPSEVEVEEIKRIDSHINVKSIVPFILYPTVIDEPFNYGSREGIMFVGGFSHLPNADGIIWFYKNIWPYIQTELPDIPFYIIGSNPTDEIKKLSSKNVHVTGYVSDKILEEYYQKSKLVIAPLRYGAGIKGKIAEAMGKGVPVVTTSIGAEGFYDVGEILAIADDADIFARKIIDFYYNEKLLEDISIKSKKYIQTRFSMDAAISIIKSDFL